MTTVCRHFINTTLNHYLHNRLCPHVTKMGTEAKGVNVICIQSFMKLRFSKGLKLYPSDSSPCKLPRAASLPVEEAQKRQDPCSSGSGRKASQTRQRSSGAFRMDRTRGCILTFCQKIGATDPNSNEYSVMFGVKVKIFETILSLVCVLQ